MMSNPPIFPSTSARFGLPLLFAGQAQKETFVNEAHALTDSIMHCAIEGEAPNPPINPIDGTAWLIGAGATGVWLGRDGSIACRQAGNWLYVAPRDGFQARNRANGQIRYFFGGWDVAHAPTEPIGGSVVDNEARIAIAELISALRITGILPSN